MSSRVVNQALARICDAALKLPLYEWDSSPEIGVGLSGSIIATIVSDSSITLPEDFIQFLQVCGELNGMDVHNGYCIGWDQAVVPSCHEGSFVSIGADGGGNVFLLGSAGVYKCNHETNELKFVSGSFAEYLSLVALDWEKYLAEDHGHSYLSG